MVFPSGRAVLRTPCSVSPETMDALADGNRFCSQCDKVVHNLIGKNEAEIKALFQAHGGRLCGMFLPVQNRPGPDIRLVHPLSKPAYFKHLAVAASILLLHQIPLQAASTGHPQKTSQQQMEHVIARPLAQPALPDGGGNTLVSAVITNRDSLVIPLDFEVAIYAKGVKVAQTIAHYGLLKLDLAGKVDPGTTIGLVIRANSASDPHTRKKQVHGALQMTQVLGASQNLTLPVDYQFPEMAPMLGDVMWEEGMEN